MERKEVECCESFELHENLLKIVRETMPEETELYDLAELFKVFGDSTRIRILFVLFEAEVCVCDLASALNMTQSAISHQLRILKQNKLVKSRREGKSVSILWQTTMFGRSSTKGGSISRKNPAAEWYRERKRGFAYKHNKKKLRKVVFGFLSASFRL